MGRKRALAPYPAFSLNLPFSLTVDEAFALSVPKPFRLQQKTVSDVISLSLFQTVDKVCFIV